MALFTAQYTTSNYKQTVVAAIPDKIILVARVCFAAGGNGSLILLSDPNGAAEAALNAALYVAANTTLDLRFGKNYGLATGRGKALGLTTNVSGSPASHSIMVWYEVVD